jgi:hypothetical protein
MSEYLHFLNEKNKKMLLISRDDYRTGLVVTVLIKIYSTMSLKFFTK